jgi:hypothetical protein
MITTGGGSQDELSRVLGERAAHVETTVCLSHRLLLISEDRLELALKEGMAKVADRTAWAVPAGILISCIIALATSAFHTLFGVAANVWQAIFYVVAVVAAVWFVACLCRYRTYTSQTFLGAIRGVASPFNDPSAIQTASPAPLDSLARRQNNDEMAAMRHGDLIKKVSRRPFAIRTGADQSALLRTRTVDRTNHALQCRHCGSAIFRAIGGMGVCPNCKMVS